MAIAWGAYAQGSDGNGIRVGIDLSRSGSTFTARYYYQTEFGMNDAQTLNRQGNAITGAVGFTNTGGGPNLINTATFTGSPGAAYNFAATITGVYHGGQPTVSLNASIPFNVPGPPGSPTISRISDTGHTVSWTRNASASAPYHTQKVQRRVFFGGAWGAWSTVANVSGTATSWTDGGTVAQRAYEWRALAANSAGTGAPSGPSSTVYTTPSPPSGCSAGKSGADIVVTWSIGPTYGLYETQVEWSTTGGASWALLATRGSGVTSHTHVAPDTGLTHRYRVRHRTTANPGAIPELASGYSVSATVQLQAPPHAPVGLAPTAVQDPADPTTLTWAHNPVDTTAQTQAQVRHRVLGEPTWTTVTVTSAATSWVLPAGTYTAGQVIEWQVSTRGQHPSFGIFSNSATIPTSTRPTVAVNTPGTAVATRTLVVEWGYDQAQGSPEVAWRVELLDSSETVVETRSGAGDASTVTLATTLPDGSSWSVRVQATSAAGLTSATDSQTFAVSYPLPPAPAVAVLWDPDTASAAVTADVPAPVGAEVPAVQVTVRRSVDGGTTWRDVATAPYDGGTPVIVTDWAPSVGGATQYQALAVSELPSEAQSADVELVTPLPGDPPGSVWLSGGPGLGQVCRAVRNVQVTVASELRERELRWYAGRRLPVEHAGTGVRRAWSVSFDVLAPGLGTLAGSPVQAWDDLVTLPGPHLLRTPDGGYVQCSVSGFTARREIGGAVWSAGFTATEIAA